MNDLRKDISKIKALRLIETSNEVIENNNYALMFDVDREVVGYDKEKFYLKTLILPTQGLYEPYNGGYALTNIVEKTTNKYWEVVEAYYSAFKYDGKYLVSEIEIPNAVNKTDRIQRTVYEIIKEGL